MVYLILSLLMMASTGEFKEKQLEHSRVKNAYAGKMQYLESILKSKNLTFENIEISIQAYKMESLLEVWAKNKTDKKFQLLVSYKICQSSGTLGPKRKEGDRQVPEGFYYINHFNPESNYHLSLGINYPNKSDKVFADKQHPGGAIYIHGNSVTIGCLPITDDKIKELYILAVEARNNGQTKIPITIFPFRMTPENLSNHQTRGRYPSSTLQLWGELQQYYQQFEKNHSVPAVIFLPGGRHQIKQ